MEFTYFKPKLTHNQIPNDSCSVNFPLAYPVECDFSRHLFSWDHMRQGHPSTQLGRHPPASARPWIGSCADLATGYEGCSVAPPHRDPSWRLRHQNQLAKSGTKLT